jgi:hypothetical protein
MELSHFFHDIYLGDKYVGEWRQGEMHGEGVKSQYDGGSIEGN